MSLIQAWLVFILSGIGMASLAYFGYRRFTRSKVICFFYNKNRTVYRKAIKPDSHNILHMGDKAYYYRESEVMTTPGFLLKEPTAALVFEEGKPNPINLWQKRPPPLGPEDISSNELSQILNDKTVSDFVNAQSAISLPQVTSVVLVVGVVLLGAVVGIGYWIKGF